MAKGGQCKAKCDPGFTSNGTKSKKCVKCDNSCNGCKDNSKEGDKKVCNFCAKEFPMRITDTQHCTDKCRDGLFASSASTCGRCKAPCKNCTITESTCTSCNTKITRLWNKQCFTLCPKGFVFIKGNCKPCNSPCSTCNKTIN